MLDARSSFRSTARSLLRCCEARGAFSTCPRLSMKRTARSSRASVADAARRQQEVIDLLRGSGHDYIAERLNRCQHARLSRRDAGANSWPWRCRNPGCWSCRRTRLAAEFRSISRFGAEADLASTLIKVPLEHEPGDLRQAVRSLRRALRDVRDRCARHDPRWLRVAVDGLAETDGAILCIRHMGLDADTLREVLLQRWPTAVVGSWTTDRAAAAHGILLTADAAALATVGRGIEPLRIKVGGRRHLRRGKARRYIQPGWGDPMPVIIA